MFLLNNRRWSIPLVLLCGLVVQADEPRPPAKEPSDEDAVNDVSRLEYATTVYRAHAEFRNGNVIRAKALLDACREDRRGWEWHYVRRLCHPELFHLPLTKADGRKQSYTSAEFSPDGRSILTTHGDKTASIWSVDTLKVTLTLTADHTLLHASYRPDGKQIVASGRTSQATVFDTSNGKATLTLTRNQRAIADSTFSSDGTRIVSSCHRELTVWDASNGKERKTFPSVAFDQCRPSMSPDGKKIVADGFGSVGVWNAEAGTIIQRLTGGGNNSLNIARFSPDGKRLVVTSNDANVRVYDDQLKEVLLLKGHAGGQSAAVYSPDSKKIATVGHDQTLRLWDANTGQELRQWKTTGWAVDVRFNHDGSQLLTVGGEGVNVWDVNAPSQPQMNVADGSWLLSVAISPNGQYIAAGNISNLGWIVEIRDRTTEKLIHSLRNHDYVVHDIEYSPDGKMLITRTGTGRTKIWNASTGELLHDLDGTGKMAFTMKACFTRDSSRVLTLREGKIHLWDANKGTKIRELKAKMAVRSMWCSADSKQIHAFVHGGEITTWNAENGEEVGTVALVDGPKTVDEIWPSPDGSRLMIGLRNENARCYSARTGKRLYTLTATIFRSARHVVFSPDGRRFATIQFGDNSIHLWDAASGHELLSITRHTKGISCLAFSPDGQQLYSAGDNGPILFHEARPMK